jgi:hypothetical protein
MFSVTAEGRQVLVSAIANIYETRPNIRYHWTLNVYDESSNKKIITKNFNDQIFSPNLGEPSAPSFEDQGSLPSGAYRVELILHSFPRDFDLSGLEDDGIEKSVRAATQFRKIQIP